MRKFGPTQQKILILFLGGIALGLSKSSIPYFRTLQKMRREWKRIDQQSFERSLHSLRERKLLEEICLANGTTVLRLTESGKKEAAYCHFLGSTMKIKRQKKWDKLWRLVLFDVPEKSRTFRDILRDHLKNIGFEELQKSVFIFPYPCEKEISYLVELYNATPHVRIITAQKIDNERALIDKFFQKKKAS